MRRALPKHCQAPPNPKDMIMKRDAGSNKIKTAVDAACKSKPKHKGKRQTDEGKPVTRKQIRSDGPDGPHALDEMLATATAGAPTAPTDHWIDARAMVVERIGRLSSADWMRLSSRRIHPSALTLEVQACPEVAEFRLKTGGEISFIMGATVHEETYSLMIGSPAAVVGTIIGTHVGIHSIEQCPWDTRKRPSLPMIPLLSSTMPAARQNPYAISVSIDGLDRVQLGRTDVTMKDVLDGFLLAHRGMVSAELDRRYEPRAASRIISVMAAVDPIHDALEGRNPQWHGWEGVTVQPVQGSDDPKTLKAVHAEHARGRYGNGMRLLTDDDHADVATVADAHTGETVALLRRALRAINLPRKAQQDIEAAIETLTIKRGKKYANRPD